jgi:hypothetical protein
MTATMTASWATTPTDAANLATGVERVISTEAEVDALLAELAAPLAEEAQLYHSDRKLLESKRKPGRKLPDHMVVVGAKDGWAYMTLSLDEEPAELQLDGDPASPGFVQGPSEFPAGSGLPVAKVAEALREFLRTSRKPGSVKWVPEKR